MFGTVKFFNQGKGFGFIKENDSNNEYFVHISKPGADTIKDNDNVEFEIGEGRKGVEVTSVKVI